MKSYINQSNSLKYVQKYGPKLEKGVKEFLGWETGRVKYLETPFYSYDLQVDALYPDKENPKVFVSVTYCNPDKPGHSNENKLQLKLGELMLLKCSYPEIKAVLVIGGTKSAWIPYVLETFKYFYDKVIFTWDDNFEEQLEEIKLNPYNILVKHENLWINLEKELKSKPLSTDSPINSFLRNNAWEYCRDNGAEGDTPDKIKNDIIRHCMEAAYERSRATRNRSGVEWTNYMNEDWDKLWESRSFFNPAEAAIELVLKKNNLAYKGGLAKDVMVPSLIHHLGGKNVDKTKVSEDFILFSKKYNMPVFIQSKATGGGKSRHGKNIQNRTKEQLARSLFYRGMIENNEVILREKDYYWIGILDGDWGVTKSNPLKYIHMLQAAGYDFFMAADKLVDDSLDLVVNNDLSKKLTELECVSEQSEFDKLWKNWLNERALF